MSSISSIISTTWQNATVANAIAAGSNVVAGVKAIAFRTLIQPVSSLVAAHPVIAASVVVVGVALGLYLIFKSCILETTTKKRPASDPNGPAVFASGNGQELAPGVSASCYDVGPPSGQPDLADLTQTTSPAVPGAQ
jgi:hypothetical protein